MGSMYMHGNQINLFYYSKHYQILYIQITISACVVCVYIDFLLYEFL